MFQHDCIVQTLQSEVEVEQWEACFRPRFLCSTCCIFISTHCRIFSSFGTKCEFFISATPRAVLLKKIYVYYLCFNRFFSSLLLSWSQGDYFSCFCFSLSQLLHRCQHAICCNLMFLCFRFSVRRDTWLQLFFLYFLVIFQAPMQLLTQSHVFVYACWFSTAEDADLCKWLNLSTVTVSWSFDLIRLKKATNQMHWKVSKFCLALLILLLLLIYLLYYSDTQQHTY